MIKIFALSVEHNPYSDQKLTASVGYNELFVTAAQSLTPSDKMRIAIIEMIIVMTGEKRGTLPGVLSTKHILKFEEDKPMAFWVNEGVDDEGKPKESFVRLLTAQEKAIMEPIVRQYQEFLRQENVPPIASDRPDNATLN